MASSSQETVTDETQNIAIDRRAVMEQGTQVIDSIVYDQSTDSVKEVMRGLVASWQTQVRANSMDLDKVSKLGGDVLKLADKSQISMSEIAYKALKNGLDQVEVMQRQGALVVDFADENSKRSFELGESALDVVAEVATADYSSNLKTLSIAVMLFSLAAMVISKGKN